MFSSRNIHFAVLGIILGASSGYILAFYQIDKKIPEKTKTLQGAGAGDQDRGVGDQKVDLSVLLLGRLAEANALIVVRHVHLDRDGVMERRRHSLRRLKVHVGDDHLAPSSESRWASASPRPCAAPVMTTTRSFKR
jgi:hypothetical protein